MDLDEDEEDMMEITSRTSEEVLMANGRLDEVVLARNRTRVQ